MVKKLTLEDLKKMRDEVRASTKLREGETPIKVIVHMGTTGIAAGAREIMAAFIQEVAKRNITNVTIAQSGSFSLESEQPAVSVEKTGVPTVSYGRVTPEKVSRILIEHILGGRVIEEWVLSKG
jgi:NADP-reducing hydrogenase subunit HndB